MKTKMGALGEISGLDERAARVSALYERIGSSPTGAFGDGDRDVILSIIEDLDQGKIRVVQKLAPGSEFPYQVNTWVKQAILLYFRLMKISPIQGGEINYLDKIPVKSWTDSMGVRVVPPAVARRGSFIEPGAILMPSFVNIGGYVGSGTMVDTWATVGSCAQVGRNVHLSGGVGLGGVLEPLQASPVIVEDHVFIGSRCIIVEGALIEEGAVLGAGVTLTASTKIFDVTVPSGKTSESGVIYKGRVPKNAVVIPGTHSKEFPAGVFGVNCALIIGQRKESTDKKTSLNQVLRDYDLTIG